MKNTAARSPLRLLALTAALAAATLYLAQPILGPITRSFGLPTIRGGWLVSVTQAGYAAGLLLVLPLSDTMARRTLMVRLMGALAVALAAVAVAPSFGFLLVDTFGVGLLASLAQVAVPLGGAFAASLGMGEGQAITIVFGGLLTGILGARIVSGLITQVLGWRALFGMAAPTVAILALMLRRTLPLLPPESRLGYRAALASMGEMLARTRGIIWGLGTSGFLGIVFGAFWTSLTFRLEGPPWHLGPAAIGAFGIFGVAGVLGAPRAGRFIDRMGPGPVVGVALGIAAVGQALIGLFGGSILLLGLGIFVYDLGHQIAFVSNQVRVQSLVVGARFRLNSLLMTTVFLGMAGGSLLGTLIWPLGHVTGLAILLFTALALAAVCHRWALGPRASSRCPL